jgi:hypothetical protein
MRTVCSLLFLFLIQQAKAQFTIDTTIAPYRDSVVIIPEDTLRITNLQPYMTVHVDSLLDYQFQVNKPIEGYYWFLKNAPVGLKINKDNGTLVFKAEKSYFLSGRLKYDQPYKVNIGVQNMNNVKDRADTNFTLMFYNTEIIPTRLRPTIASSITIDEGEPVSFFVQCSEGSFPIEHINFTSNRTLENYTLVKNCNDIFNWTPDFDFVRETDSARTKVVTLSFIGATKFGTLDTATVRVVVRDALNYPRAVQEYNLLKKNIDNYILQLKYSFIQIDKKLKKTKTTRTSFDLTTASTSLTGTVLNTTNDQDALRAGKILPSVGLALVPIKEAVASNKPVEQNQATLLRNSIKRLEYMITDNALLGDRDPELLKKTAKLRDELKQAQVQLLDVPLELTTGMTEEQLDRYFNSKKVSKKYRLKK